MENKFNELIALLNDKDKEAQLRSLFNLASHFERLELIATIREYLGIKEKSIKQLLNEI